MRYLVMPCLVLLVALVVGCSSAAPHAPLGFDRHPANSPATVAGLARPPADQTATAIALSRAVPQIERVPRPGTLRASFYTAETVLSDQNAPRGIASLTADQQVALVAAAKSASSIRIFCRGDRTRRSAAVRVRLLHRGAAVKRFLEAQGVEPARIRIFVRSTGAFVADNSTPSGCAQNRRVEIHFA